MRRKERNRKKGVKKEKRAGEKLNKKGVGEEIESIFPIFLSGDLKVPLK